MSRIRLLGALVLATAVVSVAVTAAAPGASAQDVTADRDAPAAWILVDADTGAVLDAHDEHEARPPASPVKLHTALTALERASMGSTVTVSAEAAGKPARRIDMREGEQWPLHDALASMLIVSANDAAYAIAESIGGDVAGFAAAMDEVGARYGLRDSTFLDPAGLDDQFSFEGGSLMSAYDLAIVARNFLAVPELAQFPPRPSYEFTGPDGREHRLLAQNLLLDLYEGATGLKTGSTERAGNTLVASATRGGRTLVAVVLDHPDTYGFAQGLLDLGFAASPEAATGEVLPPTRALTADARQLLVAVLPPSFVPLATTLLGSDPEAPADAAAVARGNEATQEGTIDASDAGSVGADGSSGRFVTWPRLLGAIALVALVLLMLRRNAVRRRRRLRRQRQRALEEAKRRGTLRVVEPPGAAGSVERVRKHPSFGRRRGEPSLR